MSLDDFDSSNEPMEQLKERTDIPQWGKIDISKEEWTKLKAEHSEGWIRDWMVQTIRKNDIPPPYTPYTIDEIKQEYQKLLEYDTTQLHTEEKYYIKHNIEPRWDKPMNIMWKQNNTGNKCSNYFHEKARFKADSSIAMGVDFTWNNNKLLNRTLNALWTLKLDKVNNRTLQQIMQLRGYIPSQFKPVVAKGIYEFFEAENVFDMSMGWGDRLCGFSASKYGKYYYGTDPNTVTYENYNKQLEFYNRGKEYDLFNLPAEDLTEEPKHHIDLAFTSPPYFTKERYSDDGTQSWKRYPNINSWLKEFLFKSLEFQWRFLRKGGIMIVNISDVFVDGDWNVICDPMNEFISGLDGAEYMGHMGMKMTKRPNTHSNQDGNFAEPMWVWERG